MKNFSRVAALAMLGLVLTGTAGATTLITPPASANFANETLYCGEVNVSTQTKYVTVRVHDYNGNQVDIFADTLAPGHGQQHPFFDSVIAYCTFTFTGPKSSVRAAASYNHDNVFTVTIPAQ